MRPVTFLLPAVLVLTLTTSVASKSDPTKSIRPLQTMVTDAETGKEHLDDICTAWATAVEGRLYWVTAFHCVEKNEQGFPILNVQYFVDGKPVTFKRGNYDTDIALFVGGPSVTPLPVSYMDPRPSQKVWSAGYPMDEGQVLSTGIVSSTYLEVSKLVLYQLPAAPGVSGAPVLTEDNVVVGILQRMGCPYIVGYCPESMGVPLEQLRGTLQAEETTKVEK